MSEVAFNEEVTAEILNNIGVDLGKTEFSRFEDNMPYAVHQLNQITSDLVSAGVLRTGADGSLGCEVIASDGVAYVQPGVIVFASGAKIRITQPVGVDLIPGTYIYALADSTTGTAKLEVSDTEPTGDYVMLAEVDAEGVLADRRSSSVAKVNMTADAQNVYREVVATIEDGSTETTVDAGTNAFSYVYFVSAQRVEDGKGYDYIASYDNAAPLADGGNAARFQFGETVHVPKWNVILSRSGQQITVKVRTAVSGATVSGDYAINLLIM